MHAQQVRRNVATEIWEPMIRAHSYTKLTRRSLGSIVGSFRSTMFSIEQSSVAIWLRESETFVTKGAVSCVQPWAGHDVIISSVVTRE